MATVRSAEDRITALAMRLGEFKSDLIFAPEDADPKQALALAQELQELPALLEEYQDLRYQAQKARRGTASGHQLAANLRAASPGDEQ